MIIDITDYPTVLLLVASPILWLAARFGVRLGRRFPLDDDMRQDFSTLQTASPTLLGLIIAFIADIDPPRHGTIRVNPQNLMSLASSLPPS